MAMGLEHASVRRRPQHRHWAQWRRSVWRASLFLLVGLMSCQARGGLLDFVRGEVHNGSTETRPPRNDSPREDRHRDEPNVFDSRFFDSSDVAAGTILLGVFVAASPYWVPLGITNDSYVERFFPRFPYDQSCGCLTDYYELTGRRWSGQFTLQYGTDTVNLSQLGGRLVLETTSRWGLDLQMQSIEERLRTGGHDQLWLGDGNLVFRFAQGDTMLWRTGLGLNWLDDTVGDEYGLNFTYGFDWTPVRPLVLSATIDWGTLGKTDLFRFDTSVGVLVNRVETFVGYEYLDIGHTQINQLTAGLRVWF